MVTLQLLNFLSPHPSLFLFVQEFMVAIEGTDGGGYRFRRLNSQHVSTLAIELILLPASGNKTAAICRCKVPQLYQSCGVL